MDFANLKLQHTRYISEFEESLDAVLNKANFIMGDEIKALESELCEYSGAKHCITCSNGTDALLLGVIALGLKQGDEVITTPFTFISTSEIIALAGATPVFVDINEQTYNIDENLIEAKITPKTKAIIAVSLYGQPANITALSEICQKYSLKLIIDGAQSFGSQWEGVKDSVLGDISTTSFFPSKPLGCYGDSGAVFTNDETLCEKIAQLRVHGQDRRYHHKFIGLGARLDTIQAAVLRVKLRHYKDDLALRREVASKYYEALKDKDLILPFIDKRAISAYAQFSIRVKNRDTIQARLKEKGIPTAIHYPKPLHLQECFKYLGYKLGDFPISERVSSEILSLPMNPYLSDDEIEFVAENL
ncbi:MAG: DegT/DnrJ/EryC1/StrS family aminotransferase [Campylobacter sp.]|nr:DegT/DnrJ/EryC1/StrS family aminotransferase [Campylobacter sp.]